jgi:surface polysaccharide O-acyltransferase-like enzyme
MSKEYGTIVGRVGIILLLTGIVITLVGYLRSSANTSRIDSSLVTYLGVGLAVVGVILLLIFVIEFVSNKRKHP